MWVITLKSLNRLDANVKKVYFNNQNESKLLTKNMVLALFEIQGMYRMGTKVYCDLTDKELGTITRVIARKNIPEGKPITKIISYTRIVKKEIIEIRPMNLREMQLEVVKKTLEACEGNKTKTAKILGVSLTQVKRLVKCI